MSDLIFRSIFISDVHLGTKSSKAAYLLNFLRSTQCENLYLVGDIFDLWAMTKRVHWTKEQTEVLQEVFHKAKQGTKVVYIPGNHDSVFRRFVGKEIEGVSIQLNTEHMTADGKRLMVSHGDEFDVVIKHNAILRAIGDRAYNTLLWINHVNTKFRKMLKLPYWSLSSYLKSHIKNANVYIDKYATAAANKADKEGYDGYVCGHIHKSDIRHIGNALYCNTGDWVEHCTSLVEDENGVLKILHWSDHATVKAVADQQEVVWSDMPLPVSLSALKSL